ncbi:MAG TPA: enoyl-CoA hydratase-related protein [Trebonia sp.]|jgi:2-(1,2-epoxy-1,2-dihydrophenyl)acetyl-CoA isomerase|nr:enoyl-CoA hydratase-related protein [Trebonia sp.]
MNEAVVSEVAIERDGAVATVVLPGPALSLAVKEGLLAALREVAGDPSVRAVVLTGTGRAFCVGQDLAEHAAALGADPAGALNTVDEHYNPITTLLATMPKPVVAGVNGTCVGAGLGFVLACDLVVMAAGATLGTAFTGIGLTCDSGLSVSLAAAVGTSRARALILQPRTFTAAEAVSWGMAFDLVPAGQVRLTAVALGMRLANGPTAAYAETKKLLFEGGSRPFAQSLAAEAAAQQRLSLTTDHARAVRAFLAKEKPAFTGS